MNGGGATGTSYQSGRPSTLNGTSLGRIIVATGTSYQSGRPSTW